MKAIFKETIGFELEDQFVRIPYAECIRRFGTDKPDLRYGNEIIDLTPLFENTEFAVFKNVIENGGVISALKFENAADRYSRKGLDKLQEFVKHGFKAKALAYLKMEKGVLSGSVAKPLSEEEKAAVTEKLNLKDNDLVLIIADSLKIANTALGALRVRLAKELDLVDNSIYKFLWVTEFPMFDYSEEEDRFVAVHHPFTSPMDEDFELCSTEPMKARAKAYDIVINGQEAGGGTVRIHRREVQEKMFSILGFTPEDIKERFGFFVDAFRYGAPPHGGLALGLDRLVMLLTKTDSIKEVIAFPKVQTASCLMTGAPDLVEEKQLRELHVQSIEKK
jgi:aspartyl-tRNA synthetase